MKALASAVVMVLLLIACSITPPVELVSATVEVGAGEELGVMDGNQPVRTITSKELRYHIVIKNVGEEPIGGMEDSSMLKARIVPTDQLVGLSEEIMGVNLYDEGEREKAGLGVGVSSNPLLKPNQQGEFTFRFDLGARQEHPEQVRVAPDSSDLKKLEADALHATLILFIGEKEIARFPLDEVQ